MIKPFFWYSVVVALLSSNYTAHSADESDIASGKLIYIQCSGCHAPSYHRAGPKHCGLIGRRAGSINDFTYTKELSNSQIIWSKETLDQFLAEPLLMVPGTSMGFAGIASQNERTQLIAYLSTLTKENTLCR